jgi:hypothetical protein
MLHISKSCYRNLQDIKTASGWETMSKIQIQYNMYLIDFSKFGNGVTTVNCADYFRHSSMTKMDEDKMQI